MNASRDAVSRGLALAALTVLVSGYAIGARGEEQRIASQLNQNGSAAERADGALRSLAERPALEAERRRLRQRLQRTDLGEDAARLVARFLRGAAVAAERHGAAVVSVEAGDVAHPLDPRRDAIPLALELEGSYRALLAAITDLSRLGVPASVDVVSLARAHADGPDRTLTAALHVSLLRLAAEDQPSARAEPR
jgi:hypothetical protein